MRNSSGRETTSLYDNFPVTALYSQFVIQHFLCVVSLALDRLLKMADDDDFGPDGGFSFGEEPDFGPDPGEMDLAFADDLFDPLPEEDPFASQIEGPDGAAGAAPPGAAKASAKYPPDKQPPGTESSPSPEQQQDAEEDAADMGIDVEELRSFADGKGSGITVAGDRELDLFRRLADGVGDADARRFMQERPDVGALPTPEQALWHGVRDSRHTLPKFCFNRWRNAERLFHHADLVAQYAKGRGAVGGEHLLLPEQGPGRAAGGVSSQFSGETPNFLGAMSFSQGSEFFAAGGYVGDWRVGSSGAAGGAPRSAAEGLAGVSSDVARESLLPNKTFLGSTVADYLANLAENRAARERKMDDLERAQKLRARERKAFAAERTDANDQGRSFLETWFNDQ